MLVKPLVSTDHNSQERGYYANNTQFVLFYAHYVCAVCARVYIQSCAVYWPEEDEPKQRYGPLEVQLIRTDTEENPNIIIRDFQLSTFNEVRIIIYMYICIGDFAIMLCIHTRR